MRPLFVLFCRKMFCCGELRKNWPKKGKTWPIWRATMTPCGERRIRRCSFYKYTLFSFYRERFFGRWWVHGYLPFLFLCSGSHTRSELVRSIWVQGRRSKRVSEDSEIGSLPGLIFPLFFFGLLFFFSTSCASHDTALSPSIFASRHV